MNAGPGWHLPLAIAFGLYLVTAIGIVASRMVYERRRAIYRRLAEAVRTPGADDRDVAVSAVLSGLSVRMAWKLAFEHQGPSAADEALARFLVESMGVARAVRAASAGGAGRSRWKRIAALRVLAAARPGEALAPLAAATADADKEVVAAAVAALGRMPFAAAGHLLVTALKERRYSASRLATFIDRLPADIADVLRPLAKDRDRVNRYWAATLLRRYRNVAWVEEELVGLAHDPAPAVRKAALQSLAYLRARSAVPTAVAALRDPVWFVRTHAVRALAVPEAAPHAASVAALLSDRTWWVRQAAREALVAMGSAAEPAALATLAHRDRFARNSAAEVLQNLGTFRRLLEEEVHVPGDARRRRVLRAMQTEGGPRLVDAVTESLPARLRERARAVLPTIAAESGLPGEGVAQGS